MSSFDSWKGLVAKFNIKQIGIYTLRGEICPAAEKIGFENEADVKKWFEENVEFKDYYVIYVEERRYGKTILKPIFGDEKS